MQLFRWAIVILAPGLLFLIAGVVSQTSIETLLALTKFVGFFYVGGVILMIAYMVLFWLAVRGPVIGTLSKLSNTNVLAFMTNNPIIALSVFLAFRINEAYTRWWEARILRGNREDASHAFSRKATTLIGLDTADESVPDDRA